MPTPSGMTMSLRRLLILLSAIGLLPLALFGLRSLHTARQYQQREQQRAMLDLGHEGCVAPGGGEALAMAARCAPSTCT